MLADSQCQGGHVSDVARQLVAVLPSWFTTQRTCLENVIRARYLLLYSLRVYKTLDSPRATQTALLALSPYSRPHPLLLNCTSAATFQRSYLEKNTKSFSGLHRFDLSSRTSQHFGPIQTRRTSTELLPRKRRGAETDKVNRPAHGPRGRSSQDGRSSRSS